MIPCTSEEEALAEVKRRIDSLPADRPDDASGLDVNKLTTAAATYGFEVPQWCWDFINETTRAAARAELEKAELAVAAAQAKVDAAAGVGS